MSRRIMRTFKINEISAVDRPAQAGARMTILKRDSSRDAPGLHKGTNTTGHEGIVDMTEAEVQKMIADAVTAATAELTKQLTPKPPVKKADPALEPESDEATLKAWRPYVAKAVETAVAARVAELEADFAKRVEITKADEVFTTADGTEIRKSEFGTETAFKFAKAQQETIEAQVFEKKAEAEIPNLPGATTLKARVLRAVAKLDKEVGEALTAMLKGGNAAMKASMASIGHTAPTETSPEGQLNKMAADRAAVTKETYAEAYGKVLETTEGGRLYAASEAERKQRIKAA